MQCRNSDGQVLLRTDTLLTYCHNFLCVLKEKGRDWGIIPYIFSIYDLESNEVLEDIYL